MSRTNRQRADKKESVFVDIIPGLWERMTGLLGVAVLLVLEYRLRLQGRESCGEGRRSSGRGDDVGAVMTLDCHSKYRTPGLGPISALRSTLYTLHSTLYTGISLLVAYHDFTCRPVRKCMHCLRSSTSKRTMLE